MSQIGTNIYPNTTFPDSMQSLPDFTDLSAVDQGNYINYLKQIMAGNYTAAKTYLDNITNTAVLNANKLSILKDTIGAIQDVYSNTTTFSNIINEKQAEWESIIERFGYIGTWTAFNEYVIGNTYNFGNIVIYNNKVWYCKLNNTNMAPVEGANWTQYYMKNSMISYTDSITNRTLLYIATVDITNNLNPAESDEWTLLVTTGATGTGFNFYGTYDSAVIYSYGALIVYNGMAYMSTQNNNVNHTPDPNSYDWWFPVFSISMQPIPITSNEPTNQNENDIWFHIIS